MKLKEIVKHIFVFCLPAGIIASIASFALPVLFAGLISAEAESWTDIAAVILVCVSCDCVATGGYYALLRKHITRYTVILNAVILALTAVLFTLLMIFSEGNINSTAVMTTMWAAFAYFPLILFAAVGGGGLVYPVVFISLATALFVSNMYYRRNKSYRGSVFGKRTLAGICAALAVMVALNTVLFLNRPEAKYSGHGFDYMNGFSSTDFTDYTVYSEPSKLVALDHPASLSIEDADEMPVMDGAEACYPVYAAAAKAVYKDIGAIEKQYYDNNKYSYTNGKIVTFTNTVHGFWRLADETMYPGEGRADLFFGARPSKEQLEKAEKNGVELEITPIGKEAFVFFVVKDNPVDDLTSEQLRMIYHGDITNWSEIGGLKQPIKAFQRPKNSGSQTMMEYFMGNVSLKEPDTYETIGGMGEVIKEVAQYNSEPGAMGYTFRYFLEELNQEDGVKMLSVDGVYPSVENIRNGSYPLTVDLCLITRKDDPNPNVQKMIDFMLSEDGQYIVEQTGYAPVA